MLKKPEKEILKNWNSLLGNFAHGKGEELRKIWIFKLMNDGRKDRQTVKAK